MQTLYRVYKLQYLRIYTLIYAHDDCFLFVLEELDFNLHDIKIILNYECILYETSKCILQDVGIRIGMCPCFEFVMQIKYAITW